MTIYIYTYYSLLLVIPFFAITTIGTMISTIITDHRFNSYKYIYIYPMSVGFYYSTIGIKYCNSYYHSGFHYCYYFYFLWLLWLLLLYLSYLFLSIITIIWLFWWFGAFRTLWMVTLAISDHDSQRVPSGLSHGSFCFPGETAWCSFSSSRIWESSSTSGWLYLRICIYI